MLKLLLFFVFFTSLYATQKIEIYATSMQSQDNIVKAGGEVTVVYKDYFLSAKKAIYNRETGELELFGNIRANQGKDYKLLGEYARLNISKKERIFKPFFMLEKKSKVWISADEGCANDNNFTIESGVLSGCNPNNPLWMINFSSAAYDSNTEWLDIYNAKIFIYDIPVFYTPYIGYSLNRTRRTGLLTPVLGLSSSEGVYYEQPIYIAEQNWWDLEFKPQIRTQRGYGAYSTFRFLDSKVSRGEFTAGFFKEKDSYYRDSIPKLANDAHYGFNFLYDNSDILNQWFSTNFEGQSGLYMDLNNMNDVDYINLSTNDTTENLTSQLILSRVNFFYNTDNDYFATYFKYYQDLTKESNKDTLQKLPTFHYHHYLDTYFSDHLMYNLDMQSNNIYREVGNSVLQTDINVPITLQDSFFDEYLNLSYKAYLYAQYSKFNEDKEVETNEYKDGYIARNHHIIAASTQISRAYDDVTHVVSLGSKYSVEGSESRDGFYRKYQDFCSDMNNRNTSQCEFYNITAVEEELEFDFTQYFYDTSGKQIIYHRLAQGISYETAKDRVGELENELDYQILKGINFYNNMFYNYDEKSFSKIYNKLTFSRNSFNISLSHLYKDSFLKKTPIYTPYTSYITSTARYTYSKHYSYNVRYDYDLENSLRKSVEVGYLYQKRCWDFGLRYLENNRPVLTQNGSTSIYDRYLYVTINLKPLMPSDSGSLFDWKLPDSLRGL